jgi:hypothetical protein
MRSQIGEVAAEIDRPFRQPHPEEVVVERGQGEHATLDVLEAVPCILRRRLTGVPLQPGHQGLIVVAHAVMMLAQQHRTRIMRRLQRRFPPHALDRVGDDSGDADQERAVQRVERPLLAPVDLQHAVKSADADDRHIGRGHDVMLGVDGREVVVLPLTDVAHGDGPATPQGLAGRIVRLIAGAGVADHARIPPEAGADDELLFLRQVSQHLRQRRIAGLRCDAAACFEQDVQ